jgi:ATP-dependent helicase HrpB
VKSATDLLRTGEELPIAALRSSFLLALARGPVVVSSPTGSGKSTEVPRWCEGRVLVVEPRRIACRTLAARVAHLEGCELGGAVGYIVRDENVTTDVTRIVFATPGVVLRSPALTDGARTIVLDEFHERSLDVDLLLALLLERRLRLENGENARTSQALVVMSATLDGDRVAAHLKGAHLTGDARTFPVDLRFLDGHALPDASGLATRVRRALEAAASDPGDVLVFLPGKAEIEACAVALRGAAASVVTLHGGLTLAEQRRAFEHAFDPADPHARARKVILATNVAETSLTIPGVGVVIDSGLVRQTRYHDGRGFLALVPIAEDSAAQRAGRAGRTAPGICYRLWGAAARLARSTLPEIHRESLVPLVIAAAAWKKRAEELPLLDAPKPYALEAARTDLEAWGALDPSGLLTDAGRSLFALPLDPKLARLLLEARRIDCVDDAIDLVAALAVGRPMFLPGPPPQDPHDDLRLAGCDVTALVRAVRIGRPDAHRISSFAVAEARRLRARLRRVHGLSEASSRGREPDADVDREALTRAAIGADARVVHVLRARGRDRFFSNGGTELELARDSAVQNVKDVEALVVFETHALGSGRDTRVLVTCATVVSLAAMARAGLGRDRLGAVRLESGRVLASVERVYAKRVLAARDEVPQGEVARAAIAQLFLRGSLFRGTLKTTQARLALTALAAKLATRGHPAGVASPTPVPAPADWVLARLAELGVESGDDLALLSAGDLVPPELPYESLSLLEREFPMRVSVGDATYEAEYDIDRSQVLLRMIEGSRRDPPPLAYLPRFEGLRICVDGPRGIAVVRER